LFVVVRVEEGVQKYKVFGVGKIEKDLGNFSGELEKVKWMNIIPGDGSSSVL
jgi:hypothetical protein